MAGSALGPTEVRKEHLNELLAQREADLAARAAAEKPSSPDAIAQARAASPAAAAAPIPAPPPPPPPLSPLNLTPSSAQPFDDEFAPPPPAGGAASVLLAEASPSMVRAGAAAVGGAPGAGDAVTRALREELKLKNGGRMPELKMPKTREREKEIPKDGYRVPPVLSNTFAVNSLLMQQPNKARVKDLRVEIEKQQQEAEAQREMLERQQKANMPVSARLREALAAKSVQVIHLFKSWDADGDGLVSKGEFARALTLLGVDDATADDMDELFDVLDDDGSGEISYQELRSGRRGAVTKSRNAMASVSGGGGAPSDLDISLQGPAVSRQLKELVFTRQVTEIEAYEKEKEVKSFVAPGQPLMTADVEAATRDARAAFEDAAGRAERDVARGRRAVDATAERVPLALADAGRGGDGADV